jgi:hypothetical protein
VQVVKVQYKNTVEKKGAPVKKSTTPAKVKSVWGSALHFNARNRIQLSAPINSECCTRKWTNRAAANAFQSRISSQIRWNLHVGFENFPYFHGIDKDFGNYLLS